MPRVLVTPMNQLWVNFIVRNGLKYTSIFNFPLAFSTKYFLILFNFTLKEVWSLIKKEAQKSDNEFADSFTVIIYGAPDDFDLLSLPEVLNDTNAPLLRGKPKLLYVIGLAIQMSRNVKNHIF